MVGELMKASNDLGWSVSKVNRIKLIENLGRMIVDETLGDSLGTQFDPRMDEF